MTSRRFDVYGIGNALVDYLSFVDDQFLIDKGIGKGIMTLVSTSAHDTLEGFHAHEVKMCSGGSAANTITGIAALGGTGCYSGKVGDDELGRFYRQNLAETGIEFFVEPDRLPTGSCVSFVTPDAERSMLTYLGASTQLSDSDIHIDALQQSQYLYVEGYLWDSEKARRAALHSMELARRHQVRIAFSFSDAWLVGRFRDDFSRLLTEYVDLLFLNERESEEITGFQDPQMAVRQIASRVDSVCLTCGGAGAIIAHDGGVRVTPALTMSKVVDTTGAGDLFAAGVLRGLTLGFDMTTSAMIGARAAAAIVTKVGARLDREDLTR
jgi:sugar/nucleoside kinase (ribokinase family)